MEFLYALISKLKENYIFILLVVLLIVINDALILGDFYSLKTNDIKIDNVSSDNINNQAPNKDIYVDIKGEVKKPGVYKVSNEMIVNDVINLAGGLKKNASTRNINLSKKLEDQMVIVISSKKTNSSSNKITQVKNDALITSEETASIEIKEIVDINNNSLVNINLASIDELLTLSGIGKSKADAIISYRETNKFNTIDDIKNVSGIGDSLFEKIKDSITV